MRINVISDVHYQLQGLAEAGDGADLFVCLGDLILFLDYDDPSVGILAELFGAQRAAEYVELRTANRWQEARERSSKWWAELGERARDVVQEKVAGQYADLFAQLPGGLFTYGNVDIPALWPKFLREDQRVLDGQSTTVGGVRMGFVGGGLPSPMRTPFEVPEDEYNRKVCALGPVDVLFAHIPPAVPELTYDVVARRFERGSKALLDYVHEHQPRFLLHGHIHQPLQARTRIGRTEIINVGHYRRFRQPFRLTVAP